jgi:hypothetical protein
VQGTQRLERQGMAHQQKVRIDTVVILL